MSDDRVEVMIDDGVAWHERSFSPSSLSPLFEFSEGDQRELYWFLRKLQAQNKRIDAEGREGIVFWSHGSH